jgi:hypothetical protein
VLVLVIVLDKVEVVWLVVLSPVVFGLSAAIQVNVAGILAVNGMFTACPLQIETALTLVIAGVGFTVTVTV